MTREELIFEEIGKYLDTVPYWNSSESVLEEISLAFQAGVEWADEKFSKRKDVWHDKGVPMMNEKVLLVFTNGDYDIIHPNEFVKVNADKEISSWAYIKDLI